MSRQTNSRKKLLLIAASAITIIIIAAAIVTVLLLKKPEENAESKRIRSRRIKVIGFSMEPAIKDGDIIKVTDDLSDLDCGNIVVYNNDIAYSLDNDGEPVSIDIEGNLHKCTMVQRVIAKGGQTVDIRDGKVWIDGSVIDEPYIDESDSTIVMDGFDGQYPITIPEGYYFVLGDNRRHSIDSRSADVGLVKEEQIIGRMK